MSNCFHSTKYQLCLRYACIFCPAKLIQRNDNNGLLSVNACVKLISASLLLAGSRKLFETVDQKTSIPLLPTQSASSLGQSACYRLNTGFIKPRTGPIGGMGGFTPDEWALFFVPGRVRIRERLEVTQSTSGAAVTEFEMHSTVDPSRHHIQDGEN